MHSCLYEGTVRHRRFGDPAHEFRDSLFLLYLDLSELDQVFRGRWLWSAKRRALAEFRRADHWGDPSVPLDTSIRQLVSSKTGRAPKGPIRLLTHLRYFGYVMNPVCFYFCYDLNGTRPEAVVAEVNNTPWGERHCYVIDAKTSDAASWRETSEGRTITAEHEKEFHVSPFLPMDLTYRWKISAPGQSLTIFLQNLRQHQPVFDATLTLRRRAITSGTLAWSLCRYPFMTGQVIAKIYWQALRLWLKGVAFHAHPKALRVPADSALMAAADDAVAPGKGYGHRPISESATALSAAGSVAAATPHPPRSKQVSGNSE